MIRNRLFRVSYDYRNPVTKNQAQVLLLINGILFLFWLIWFSIAFIFLDVDPTLQFASILFFFVLPVVSIGVHVLVQTGNLSAASMVFLVFLLVTTGGTVSQQLHTPNVLSALIPIIVATTLLGKRGVVFATFAMIVFVLLGASAQYNMTSVSTETPAEALGVNFIVVLSVLLVGATFLYSFGDLHTPLIGKSLKSIKQLQLIAQFGNRIDRNIEQSIYVKAIEFIRDDLGYVFTQVFLVDDAGKLSRRVRGTQLTRSDQFYSTVSLGDANILMEAFQTKQIITVDLEAPMIRRNHLLPAVNYGIAVPIVHHDEVLGILDVQTNTTHVTSEQLDILQTLSDYLASLMIDIRTVQILRRSLREQEEITIGLRNQLQTYKKGGWVTAQDANPAWRASSFQRVETALGYDINVQNNLLTPAYDLPKELRAVMEAGNIHEEQHDNHYTTYIPVALRGEVLGAMTFNTENPLNQRQQEMAQSVANRLALALENVRLFEQSQTQANRERKASEATNLLLTATDIDAVLKLASNSFNDALGAINTRIHLQPEIIRDEIGTQPLPSIDISSENDLPSPKEVDTP